MGTTADKWCAFLLGDENFFKIFRAAPEKISPVLRRYKAQTTEEIYKKCLQNRLDTEDNFSEFLNQVNWRVGQELDAENQSKFNDVYYYLFSDKSLREDLGSFHSLKLAYVFDELLPTPNSKLVRQIQASWAAFAATGNPNNEFILHWEKYSAENSQTMELNSKKYVCHKDLNTNNLNSLRYVYES